MGVPYVPILGLVGTDLLKRRDDMVIAVDPFDGKTKTVVAKALRPDVAVFHAQKADRQGNVSCGYEAEVVILAEASKHVIVTAETIVERLTEKEAAGAFIPGIHVDAVAHAPFGAHPAGVVFRTEHTRRSLVERVDFVSAAGSTPPDVLRLGHPTKVVTPKAMFHFEKDAGVLKLATIYPPWTLDDSGRTPVSTWKRAGRFRRHPRPATRNCTCCGR